ncbi:MAG: hypothetical protein ACI909_003209, partial [Planctomycetota bacterium]
MTLNRRDFIKQGGLTLSFALAGSNVLLTPAQAHAKAIPYAVLDANEVALLEAVCEILLPGAKEEGVAHFVDQQLSVDPNDSLLVLKYFGYPPPYVDFYRPALVECQKLSQRMFKKDVAQLAKAESHKLIEAIRDGKAEGWNGPPPPLVYHAMRNDSVDVVYGTVKGFEKLGIPYMEHILPPE